MIAIALPGTIIALALAAWLALTAGAVISAVGRVVDHRSNVNSGEAETFGDDQTKRFDRRDLHQTPSGWTVSRDPSERMPIAA